MIDSSMCAGALERCLEEISNEEEVPPEDPRVQRMANFIQGLMLHHLTSRVADYYHIHSPDFQEKLSFLVTDAFGKELFQTFRERAQADSQFIIGIAKRISKIETKRLSEQIPVRRVNSMYLSIFLKYFRFDSLSALLSHLRSDEQIQKLVFTTLVEENCGKLTTPVASYLIHQDKRNFLTHLFIQYGKSVRPWLDSFEAFSKSQKSPPLVRFGAKAIHALLPIPHGLR